MEVSPNALRKETVTTLKDVEALLREVKGDGAREAIDVPLGIISPLLLAKAQCLQTLTLLREQQDRRA